MLSTQITEISGISKLSDLRRLTVSDVSFYKYEKYERVNIGEEGADVTKDVYLLAFNRSISFFDWDSTGAGAYGVRIIEGVLQ